MNKYTRIFLSSLASSPELRLVRGGLRMDIQGDGKLKKDVAFAPVDSGVERDEAQNVVFVRVRGGDSVERDPDLNENPHARPRKRSGGISSRRPEKSPKFTLILELPTTYSASRVARRGPLVTTVTVSALTCCSVCRWKASTSQASHLPKHGR
jgi:hypothetical protein